jgi:mannose-6-phosphate isomerase-like protein (cupin superfamily)
MSYQSINFQQKFALFKDQWLPKVIAEMNDYQFKVVKLQGDFIWHDHQETDETFIVLDGELRIDFRDGAVVVSTSEMFAVPKGVEPKPYAEQKVKLLLIEDEYGWDERYEALVAKICADFIDNFDPKKERCWIAEMDGERVGSVFLVKGDDEKTSKLRLLIVEPKARGLKLGSKLVDECIRFAKRSGYEKMTLWTNSVLLAARYIYQKAGFQVVREEKHHSFGQDWTGETWGLNLTEQVEQ